MSKALLVVDMQEFAVGENHEKMFTYDNAALIQNVNTVITSYDKNSVYYIVNIMDDNFINKFAPFKVYDNSPEAALADGLSIVNDNIIKKHYGDAFTNPQLDNTLKANGITDVDIIGVDGGGCVYLTAMGALKAGYKVNLLKDAIGSISQKKTDKFYYRLIKLGAIII